MDAAQQHASLTEAERAELLQIARLTLDHYLGSGTRPRLSIATPGLREDRASFVSLWRQDSGELRGCRGEIRPSRPLAESVAQMAILSATDDPRFPAVEHAELPQLRIEINVLTPLRPIEPDDIVVGRHGLLLVAGRASGVLLPEVAAERHWDVPAFLRAVCHKAGLPDDAWRAGDAQLYGFETEAWSE